jgi:enhancing lycopene biosynthesis protein 2
VAVKTGVGDRVADGVVVGVNDIAGVGESTTATGKPASAVCVAPAIIVDMTAVPSTFRSCVGAGTPDTAQAKESIIQTVTDKRMGVFFFILPPFGTRQS